MASSSTKAKAKRKPGEKPKRRFHRTTPALPPFGTPQQPKGLSPLAEFIESCQGEVTWDEAVREFQQEWCDHPRKKASLVVTTGNPTDEEYKYTVACNECGLHRERKGKPPAWLTKQ